MSSNHNSFVYSINIKNEVAANTNTNNFYKRIIRLGNLFGCHKRGSFLGVQIVAAKKFEEITDDDPPLVTQIRTLLLGYFQNLQSLEDKKYFQKMQYEYPKSTKFFCDGKNGPGKRSVVRPDSIHQLRPGDIDIVANMGDSLTAGNGLAGTNILDMGVENRGMAFTIGGQGTWRKYMTLPNFLKEFNPNLYGYSLGNALSIDRKSRFNVAEGAADSHDTLYQAKVLKQRLIHDPKVNMTHDWKIVSIFLGGINICQFVCYYDIKALINSHEKDLVKALRFLRDNIPRLMVNIIPPANTRQLMETKKSDYCKFATELICPCFIDDLKHDYMEKIISEWYERDKEIVKREEFNTNDFTVNIIPFIKKFQIPVLKNGLLDLRYFGVDCIHFSQKLHQIAAIAYWNNLLEREGEKNESSNVHMLKLKCPTEERPFIATRQNSLN